MNDLLDPFSCVLSKVAQLTFLWCDNKQTQVVEGITVSEVYLRNIVHKKQAEI